MGRFNLLDEPWISVLDKTGVKKEVSMMDFFQNANDYIALAGEMETQNFALMRFLLSVVQTVFSRFDYEGNVLPGVKIDENFRQLSHVDEDEIGDYCSAVNECWMNLHSSDHFPDIIFKYLEKWRDRFYLFDEKYPFYQVNDREMKKISGRTTTIYGKNINRTISESENKLALFSPIANTSKGKRSVRDVMTAPELARWLLMFQGYSGLADKVSVTPKNQRSSKGWLFDLGGIYILESNVFETMIVNYMPESPMESIDFCGRCQRPCWELNGIEVVNKLCQGSSIDNLAELYTNWSRAVYIDPKMDMPGPVELHVVKLPEIDHTENSIEPMTLWKWNENGPNKDHYTPKKHSIDQSLWRNFGIITMKTATKQHQPGILRQYQRLVDSAGKRLVELVGVSMQDDANSTSWLPVNEIMDSFHINGLVVKDTDVNGWVVRISDTVETTKNIVSDIFRYFLKGICDIRNLNQTADSFMTNEVEKLYSNIDFAFKEWLLSIRAEDTKEEKINEWYVKLRKMVLDQGEELFENSTTRDLVGIEKEGKIENIATKYWQFVGMINKKIGKGGDAI